MAIGVITSVTVIVCCFLISFFRFKTKELDYKKLDSEYTQKTLKERTALEIEQEKTKQRLLEKEKETEYRKQKEEQTKQEVERTKQEVERTKQLEVRSNHEKETGKYLSR